MRKRESLAAVEVNVGISNTHTDTKTFSVARVACEHLALLHSQTLSFARFKNTIEAALAVAAQQNRCDASLHYFLNVVRFSFFNR